MTEDEEDSTKDEVPQRSDLLQDSNNNVHHDTEIEEGNTEKSRNVNIVGRWGGGGIKADPMKELTRLAIHSSTQMMACYVTLLVGWMVQTY